MNNAATGVSIPLSTFGGLSTELSPTDLPEGGSPDNQDCAYLPGSVLTRPGMRRIYATEPESTAVLSQDTFTRKDGAIFNVKLYASGNIWAENFTSAPLVWSLVGTVPPGSRFKSVSAFGRLFMTFNDGTRGTDLPRSFDGTKWNRASQGGPCINPSFSEYILPSLALATMGGGASTSITSLTATDPHSYQRKVWDGGDWSIETITIYATLTIVVSSSAGFVVGETVNISGNPGFTGALTIQSIAGTSIVCGYSGDDTNGSGGTLSTGSGITLSRLSDIVTAGTVSAHGMQPGDMFTLSGTTNVTLGTITTAVRASNVITITTSAANGVRVGSRVVITGVTDTTFDGTWTVSGVISATVFQIESSNLADASSSSGTVFGTWDNTQRFVISAPTATTLTYNDPGPDAQSATSGTITPVGQIAGGERNAVCIFETDYGYLTPPSVPVRVTTSGGKKLVVNGIPIGPANVVKRIIAFTGIDGSAYFYIPVPVRSNGNVIGSSTVIGDNTSTTAVFDFSDDALLSATGIDIDGNNLFELKILGNCSGVASYADRIFWWGDENKAINFLNMGFEGGINADGSPAGWTVSGSGVSVVPNADFGDGVQFAAGSTAKLFQSVYLDFYGDEILEPSTQYTFKCWAKQSGTGASVVAEIYDTNALTVLATVTLAVPTTAGFVSGVFSAKTPTAIPSTAVLRVYVTGNGSSVVTLDELSAIFTNKPYNDTAFSVSYVNNPESVDSITGVLGATADPTRILDASRLKDNLYFVTEERLHTTKNVTTEPSTWDVNEIADKCGACSMFSMISGESWLGWASKDGARLFDSSQPIKVTQDIQSRWDALNSAALKYVWGINDSANRRIYWGVPEESGSYTDSVLMLDYRHAETGQEIEDRGSLRISAYSGKMLVLELSRKFSPWTIPASSGGFMVTSQGKIPTFSDALGRTYWLDATKYHDDDYGTIPSYYVTSPFVSGDMEQQLQLSNGRHLYTFMAPFISGTGKVAFTPLADSLNNSWQVRGPYKMSFDPFKPMEIPINVGAARCFFRIDAIPDPDVPGSLDAAFNLSRMMVVMEPHPYSPTWGSR